MALLKFKRSAVPAKVPALNDIALGELAINTYDGKVYTKKDNGTASIVEVGGGAGGGVTSFNTRTGAVTLSGSDVTTALGFTPANKAGDTFTGPITVNSGANQAILGSDGAIELTRGAGGAYIDFKDSTAEDFDVRLQASGSQLNISAAGGLTLNGAGVLTGITSGQVTTALGYTPYNATNPAGYITSSALSAYLPLTGGSLNVGGVANTHQFLYNESGGEIQLIDSTGAGPILIDNVSGLARFYKVGSGAMSIGTTGANYLQYITNGAERMRISSSGDLGIGTSAPAGKLHVVAGANNSLLFRGAINYATGGSIYAVNEANTAVTPMELAASSFFLTGGNVGIGIISAAYQLQVQGLGQDTAALTDAGNKGGSLYIRANGTTSGSGGALLFGTTFGNQTPFAAIKALVTDGGGNTTGDLAFSTRNATSDTALTERMRIALNGNVGIGLGNPSTKLEILSGTVGTTAGNEISIVNQRAVAGGNSVQILSRLIRASNGTDWTTTTMRLQGRVDASDFGYIDLVTGGAANLAFGIGATEVMRINTSGNVGVGTSAPQNKLDIVGNVLSREDNSSGANPVLLRNSNSGNNTTKSSSALFQGTDTVGTVKNIGSIGFFPDDANYISANLRFLVRSGDAAPTERMRINSSGNVGIGNSDAGYRLDISAADTTSGLGYAMRLRSNATAAAATLQFTNSPVSAQNGLISCTDSGIITLQGGDGGSSAIAFRVTGNERFRINSTGGMTSSDLSDAVGYKGLPQNQRTGAYTLALSDIGKHLYVTAGAFAVTLPADATLNFPVGAAITFVCEDAAKTIVPASGVALVLAGTGAATTGTRTLAIGSVATLLKVQANRWYISGSGVT